MIALAALLATNDVADKSLPKVLEQIRMSQGEYLDIRILGWDGTVLVVSPANDDVLGSDMSYTPQFVESKKTGLVTWSKAYISPDLNKPVAAIAIPYEQGVIVANYDFVRLRKRVREFAPEVGLTIVVLDSAGTVLAHSDSGRASRREWAASSPAFMGLSKSDSRHEIMNIDGSEELVTATLISATGWTLVVTQKMDTITSSIIRIDRKSVE